METAQEERQSLFPIDVALREGCFLAGSRGSGKTNGAKLLAAEALSEGIEVKVIDATLQWKTFPLPSIRVRRGQAVESRFNAVYDVARLGVLETRRFVSTMLAQDLEEAIHLTDMGKKPRCLVVLEECQNVLPSNTLRTLKFQDVSRFVTQGRNFGLSFVATTQRLASVDINLVELAGLRLWFKLEGHRNLSKARWWLSKYQTWNLRNLQVGQCYMQVGSNVKLLKLPLFREESIVKVIA
jgi:hypothetical protein